MKLGFRIFVFCITVLMISACKKDSNNLITKLSASINGETWNSAIRITVKNDAGFIITATRVNTSLVTSELAIRINGFSTGTYNVIATSNNCLATFTPNVSEATKSYVSATGTVVLTEVNTGDKTISGTFEFVCANLSLETITITNGSFEGLSYTETSGN